MAQRASRRKASQAIQDYVASTSPAFIILIHYLSPQHNLRRNVTGVGVGLHQSSIARQTLLRTLAATVRREGHNRWLILGSALPPACAHYFEPFDFVTAPITFHKDSSQQASLGKAAFTGSFTGRICISDMNIQA